MKTLYLAYAVHTLRMLSGWFPTIGQENIPTNHEIGREARISYRRLLGFRMNVLDQVADVAHPCKPWEVHHRWSELVTEEFFKQVSSSSVANGQLEIPPSSRYIRNRTTVIRV